MTRRFDARDALRRRGAMWTRRSALIGATVGALVATACGPDPGPAAPTWVTTGIERTVTAGATTNFAGAWTDDRWAATIEIVSPVGGPSTATLLVSPRTGPGNSVLGSPQRVVLSINAGFPRLVGTHLIGVAGTRSGPTPSPAIEVFREAAGVWASIGVIDVPVGEQAIAMSDDWVVTRTDVVDPGTESVLRARRLDTSGATVAAGPPQTLPPDPGWSLALREGFGVPGVAIDGGLIVAGSQGQFTPAPGGARVFRLQAGTWTPVVSLGGGPSDPVGYARAVAADDGPSADRFAIGPVSDSLPVVQVYADTGAGFALEQTVIRDTSLPDAYSGLYFGSAVALDGDLLAIASRAVDVASSTPGHAPVRVGYVALHRKGAVWAPEAEVPLFRTPGPAGVTSSLAFRLQAAGNHVAATVLMSPDPPPGCVFPCFTLGFEAWSIDRTG